MSDESPAVARAGELVGQLRAQIGNALVGQECAVEQTLMALLAAGHVLIEGVPGLGKTLLARSLARTLALTVARVQFTSDLLPADILGRAHFDPATQAMQALPGPVFTHILLADEINRAPARTQSALLEAMQERQVTLGGRTTPLPRPFMVLATQNPLDTEGTYPLPESQLDRFMLHIDMRYPRESEEAQLVARVTTERSGDELPLAGVAPVLSERAVLALQQLAARQQVEPAIIDYAVRLARATRGWPGIAVGAGSRGPIALIRAAKAAALIAARSVVDADDVRAVALPALRHRISLSADARLDARTAEELLTEILDSVAPPAS